MDSFLSDQFYSFITVIVIVMVLYFFNKFETRNETPTKIPSGLILSLK